MSRGNRPNYRAAVETALCLTDSAGRDSSKLAECAAARVGGTAGAVTQCMAAQPSNTRDPLGASVQSIRAWQEHRRYIIACSKPAMLAARLLDAQMVYSIEDLVVQSRVSRASGDRALAACAGQALLPGEAGRLAGCATGKSSQGAGSIGICAMSPSVNEEWRIAAECAVNSGGEPISFASCTGGRLTIRELTKCIGGKIGEDCWPNNTIRKYYENMFNDLKNGLGTEQ